LEATGAGTGPAVNDNLACKLVLGNLLAFKPAKIVCSTGTDLTSTFNFKLAIFGIINPVFTVANQ
jgi:hypothetical protein